MPASGCQFQSNEIFCMPTVGVEIGHSLLLTYLNTGGFRDFRPISRYISQTMQDIAIVTMEANRNTYAIYQMVPFPMTLNEP